MGGGGGTMKTNADPWKYAVPYLLGTGGSQRFLGISPNGAARVGYVGSGIDGGSAANGDMPGVLGIFPEAQRLYEQSGWTPEMQKMSEMYNQEVLARASSPNMGYAQSGAGDVMRGAYDSNFGPVASINSPSVDMTAARRGQGVLNPTNAMYNLLSGKPDNQYLDKQAGAITDQLTRNLNENVMPGIRSEALISGQYGGSRQGIAEGLAASRLNQDLAPALTGMYAGAHENAQQRMFGTANALNQQAFQNAQANAGLNMQGQQFNANLGLQNNQQLMAKNAQNLNNRMQGLNILGTTQNMQDSNYASILNSLQNPQNTNWQNLAQYSGIINPMVGGSTSQDMNKNKFAGAAGGALAGGMLGASMAGTGALTGAEAGSAAGPYGAAIGAVLGGLAGAFM